MRIKTDLAVGFCLMMVGTAPTLAHDYTSVSVTQITVPT